jgi:ribosomal protein S18 acetylase RimI-like enzyme
VKDRDKRRYRAIAQLHARHINQGFLSTLGTPFLTLLYETIDRTPGGILRTVDADGQTAGFVAGAVSTRLIFRSLLRRLPAVAMALLPIVIQPARWLRLLETIRLAAGSTKPDGDWPDAELLSIVIGDAHRRRGHAEALYRQLQGEFARIGIAQFRILVGGDLAGAHAFYRRMGAVAVGEVTAHKGATSIVYVSKA